MKLTDETITSWENTSKSCHPQIDCDLRLDKKHALLIADWREMKTRIAEFEGLLREADKALFVDSCVPRIMASKRIRSALAVGESNEIEPRR